MLCFIAVVQWVGCRPVSPCPAARLNARRVAYLLRDGSREVTALEQVKREEHNVLMNRALAILVMILILGVLVAVERALTVALHKRRRPRRARTLPQEAIALGGFLALILPIGLLQPRLGWLWTIDLLLLTCGAWSILVRVVLFGVPDPPYPDEPIR